MRTYKITLRNKAIATRAERIVEEYCFAAAASVGYLMKNNRNAEVTTKGSWWHIESITEIEPLNKPIDKKDCEPTDWHTEWGWSSDGEMT